MIELKEDIRKNSKCLRLTPPTDYERSCLLFGAVVEGWQADLILIEGAIYADADALHRILAVWTDGRAVMRRQPRNTTQEAP